MKKPEKNNEKDENIMTKPEQIIKKKPEQIMKNSKQMKKPETIITKPEKKHEKPENIMKQPEKNEKPDGIRWFIIFFICFPTKIHMTQIIRHQMTRTWEPPSPSAMADLRSNTYQLLHQL